VSDAPFGYVNVFKAHVNVGFFLGAELKKGKPPCRWLDTERCNSIALEQIRKFGITRVRDGDQLVGTLSGGERQVIAIGRAMYFGAKVLILDEPTSALGVKEASTVLRFINHAKNQGVGVVFITHNAHHAMSAGDTFVVLIQGQVAARFRRGEKSSVEVLSLMAGGEQVEDVAGEFALGVDHGIALSRREAEPASAGWRKDGVTGKSDPWE
jgi:simple sugar transport system ATP-binding protein